jgi:hypothetical protein
MKFPFVFVGLAAVVASSPAAAQASAPAASTPVAQVMECRKLADPEARLRCYDGTVDSLSKALSGGSLVVVDREDVRRTRRSLFGFSLPKLPFFKGDNSQDDTPDEIIATIKSVRPLPQGNDMWAIVLDSGAEWHTVQEGSSQSEPKAGQKIKIKSGALGSYRVSVSGRPGLRAIRVR